MGDSKGFCVVYQSPPPPQLVQNWTSLAYSGAINECEDGAPVSLVPPYT